MSADLSRFIIRQPCPENWGAMPGDQKFRFCEQCQKNVYNLEALSDEEIRKLVETGESICGRMKRPDRPTSIRPTKRQRKFQFSIAGLLLLITSSSGLFAAIPWVGRKIGPVVERWMQNDPTPNANPVMGEIYWEGDIEIMEDEDLIGETSTDEGPECATEW